ncbi:unnamed protein product [Rotaria sordida]|uniref:Uncharacterized protein n=1 Tax=Rotaria sordida TaxID=392033 RepID=A0A813S060_9BILA|nr:unnamed protein product [Rotaria sordida]CAF3783330.1 unnamed protein product [Rotaria sordida]
MPKEKRHKKKHHNSTTNENEKINEQSKSQLFSETDANSVEVSGYIMDRGAPQINQLMKGRTIPTGVVDIDKSVQLPKSSSKSRHRHNHSKPHTVLQPSENHHKEHVHLPPISDPSHHHHNHHYPPPDYDYFGYLSHSNLVDPEHESHHHHHFGDLSYPNPGDHEHKSSHHHHHHQHKHHHRHHHHKHEKEVETYDPRWWYLPINSVHAPKPWRPPEYHYVAPKWYESPSKDSRISINTEESILPPRKYIDCRCEVCKPSKDTSRGIRWVVNE